MLPFSLFHGKLCERLHQILVGWEYKLQNVRRIRINVHIRLDLLLLLGRKMMYLGYDPWWVRVLGSATALSHSFLLAQAIFEPNLFPYKYSKVFKPKYLSYLSAYEDGTECSETSAYKIQTPGNYPEQSIQYYLIILTITCDEYKASSSLLRNNFLHPVTSFVSDIVPYLWQFPSISSSRETDRV